MPRGHNSQKMDLKKVGIIKLFDFYLGLSPVLVRYNYYSLYSSKKYCIDWTDESEKLGMVCRKVIETEIRT